MYFRFYIFAIFTFYFTSNIFAQYNVKIDAYVFDKDANKPIPYVNVGFVEKGIGTVTNEKGYFHLEYDENTIGKNTMLQISSIGYKTLKISVPELFKKLRSYNRIYMTPNIDQLSEITILSQKRNLKTLGYLDTDPGHMGYWKDEKALGGEIASFIKVRNKNTRLLSLKYRIHENMSDSILVRVNIYKEKNRGPGNNILSTNIYHTIKKKKGIDIINLNPYNIIVHEDIIVSLELIKVYGESIEFSISASKKGRSYLRYISQDTWRYFDNVGMSMILETSYPTEDKELIVRKKPDNIVIYWDQSLSMHNRKIDEELDLLEKYLSYLKNASVEVVFFSDKINKREKFLIKEGNSKRLRKVLKNTKYLGASNFTPLFKEKVIPDKYLIFTDGNMTYGELDKLYHTPVFYINTSEQSDNAKMQDHSLGSEGHYINLRLYNTKLALKYLMYFKDDATIYNDNDQEKITGQVLINEEPAQGVTVVVDGSLRETVTDKNGNFSLRAELGEVISFELLGFNKEKIVFDGNSELNLKLVSKYNLLEKVELSTKKREEETIELIGNTVKKNAIGGASYMLRQEDFSPSATDFADIIRNRIPGVIVSGYGEGATYTIRDTADPVFIVDGNIYREAPHYLQPSMIESITVISSAGGLVRFGFSGEGKGFVIVTKGAVPKEQSKETDKNMFLAKGNHYSEKKPFPGSKQKSS